MLSAQLYCEPKNALKTNFIHIKNTALNFLSVGTHSQKGKEILSIFWKELTEGISEKSTNGLGGKSEFTTEVGKHVL